MMIDTTPVLVHANASINLAMNDSSTTMKLSASQSESNLSELSYDAEGTAVTDASSVIYSLNNDEISSDDDDEDDRSSRIRVSFGPIHVREYERIVGDHPDTQVGVPLSIGWAYYDRETGVSIEKYEADRIQKGNLRMSSITRKNLLHNIFGIPEEELRAAEKEVQQIKKHKERADRHKKLSYKTESAMKGIGRKLRQGGVSFLKGMSAAAQSGMLFSSASATSSSYLY
jgi:hypothetical protein